MAIGAIGFFGRGDLMRQRMYWNAQRSAMPLSSFAQGSVVDVGMMPGSVEGPARGETPAVPAVSGYGSYSGWGLASGQVLSAVAGGAVGGPVGVALLLKRNNQSIAHAKKMVAHWGRVVSRLRSKNKKDRRIAKAVVNLAHWKRVLAQLQRRKAALQKAKSHRKWERGFTKRSRKAARRGQVLPFTRAQKRRMLALPTASQAASMASLASSSSQGAMVPPGSYDYMAATSLPTTATSSAYAPSQLARAQDVDINDDGVRDDITGSTSFGPGGADEAADAAMTETSDEGGIMDKITGFFSDIPTWAKIGGAVVVGGALFSRTAAGKKFIAKLKRGGGGE